MLDQLPLRIARTEPAAEGIQLIELRAPDGGELPPFTAGAHLALLTPNGAARKYSLCNDPAERDRYLIAVKREASGRGGSVNLIDEGRPGQVLSAAPPRNDFAMTGRPVSRLFVAGGIGITPIRSMALELLRTGERPFRLVYLTRSPAETAFREEFSGPDYRGKVTLHHDGGDPARAFDLWPLLEEPKGRAIHCCGPRGLMTAVRDMTGHWPASAVHFEDFGAAGTLATPDDRAFTVRLARSGAVIEVPVGRTMLEALRANGRDLKSSCESGTCGTCRTGLLGGEADHRDLFLGEGERASAVMPCVSRALTPELVLDL